MRISESFSRAFRMHRISRASHFKSFPTERLTALLFIQNIPPILIGLHSLANSDYWTIDVRHTTLHGHFIMLWSKARSLVYLATRSKRSNAKCKLPLHKEERQIPKWNNIYYFLLLWLYRLSYNLSPFSSNVTKQLARILFKARRWTLWKTPLAKIQLQQYYWYQDQVELAAVEKEQGFSSANTLSPNDSTYHVVSLGYTWPFKKRLFCTFIHFGSTPPRR